MNAQPDYEPEDLRRRETVVQAIVDALQAVVPPNVRLGREGLSAGVTGVLAIWFGDAHEPPINGRTTA